MKARNVPLRLWNFCCKWACSDKACMASNLFSMEGPTPWEVVHGYTPDISSLAEFDFYKPLWYYDSGDIPKPNRHLDRWLGEATHIHIGQAMCYHAVPISGIPIARSYVQQVTEADKMTDKVHQELQTLDQAITEKLGSYKDEYTPDYFDLQVIGDDLQDNGDVTLHFDLVEEGREDFELEVLDRYLAAQVCLPLDDSLVLGKVVARKRDANGNPIRRSAENPVFDTRIYQVEFQTEA
jgi:hypothetical protein